MLGKVQNTLEFGKDVEVFGLCIRYIYANHWFCIVQFSAIENLLFAQSDLEFW